MPKIEFEPQVRDALAGLVRRHLKRELDVEIETFDAVFLLDYLSETLGPHYYNQGLRDAQALIQAKVELLGEAIYELEQPALLR